MTLPIALVRRISPQKHSVSHRCRLIQIVLENTVFITEAHDTPWLDVGDIHFSNGKCSTLVLFKRLQPYQDINELY